MKTNFYREGGHSSAPIRGSEVPSGPLSAPSLLTGGPTGISPDNVGRYNYRCSSSLSTVNNAPTSDYIYTSVPPKTLQPRLSLCKWLENKLIL